MRVHSSVQRTRRWAAVLLFFGRPPSLPSGEAGSFGGEDSGGVRTRHFGALHVTSPRPTLVNTNVELLETLGRECNPLSIENKLSAS